MIERWACLIVGVVAVVIGAVVFLGLVVRATGSSPRHHTRRGDDQ